MYEKFGNGNGTGLWKCISVVATGIALFAATDSIINRRDVEHRVTVLETNYPNIDKKLDAVIEKLDKYIEQSPASRNRAGSSSNAAEKTTS